MEFAEELRMHQYSTYRMLKNTLYMRHKVGDYVPIGNIPCVHVEPVENNTMNVTHVGLRPSPASENERYALHAKTDDGNEYLVDIQTAEAYADEYPDLFITSAIYTFYAEALDAL